MKAAIPLFFDLHLLTIFYTLFLKFSFLSASGEKSDTLKLISDFRSSFFSGSKEDAYYLLDLGLVERAPLVVLLPELDAEDVLARPLLQDGVCLPHVINFIE